MLRYKWNKLVALLVVVSMLTMLSVPAYAAVDDIADTSGVVSSPEAGEGVEPPMPEAGEGAEPPMSEAGEGVEIPMPEPGEGAEPPMSEPGEGAEPPMSEPGEGAEPPMSEPGEGAEPPMSDPGEGAEPPMSEAGEGVEPPMPEPGEGVETPLPELSEGVEVPLLEENSEIVDVTGAKVTETAGAYTMRGGDTVLTGASDSGVSITIDTTSETAITLLDASFTGQPGAPAITIASGTSVTLELEGTSELVGGEGCPAILVSDDATLTLIGAGELHVLGGSNGAGIGVNIGGSLNIEDGSIYAEGSTSSAGIGGSKTAPLYGDITITGGSIESTGGTGGAGIGSGANDGTGVGSASYKMLITDWGTIFIEGGSVTAKGGNGGAGIGGGTHVDSGLVEITGGTVTAAGIGGGAGIGSGLGSHDGQTQGKGPGYYFARIHIGGDAVIESATGEWLAAGIGGGYCADAYITIDGGTIELAQGGDGNNGAFYQGAPGIGGGYQGYTELAITNATVNEAVGGWSAPGIGSGAAALAEKRGGAASIAAENSFIQIENATVSAQGGMYAPGIGAGRGSEHGSIEISDSTIHAVGYQSDANQKWGGAGIGSGVGPSADIKYGADTQTSIMISDSEVYALGGWGASGIGSGALNKTVVDLSITGGDITAFSDGTKFAIDTEKGEKQWLVTGNVLQGTFVNMEDGRYAGQTVALGGGAEPIKLPEGYRSFARTLDEAGTYRLSIAGTETGAVAFNTTAPHEDREKDDGDQNTFQYVVQAESLSDNYWLYVDVPTEPTEPGEPGATPTPTPLPTNPSGGGSDDDDEPTPRPTVPVTEPIPEETIIEENDIPLGELPAQAQPALPPVPVDGDESVIIDESQVPLGNLPQTGSRAGSQGAAALLGLGALTAIAGALWSAKRKPQ